MALEDSNTPPDGAIGAETPTAAPIADGQLRATPRHNGRAHVPLTHEQLAKAFQRVRGQTTLPDHRVREVLNKAISDSQSRPTTTLIEPIEQVIMLATELLWAEEKAMKSAGTYRGGTGF